MKTLPLKSSIANGSILIKKDSDVNFIIISCNCGFTLNGIVTVDEPCRFVLYVFTRDFKLNSFSELVSVLLYLKVC